MFQIVLLEVESYLKGNDSRRVIPFIKYGGRIGDEFVDIKYPTTYEPGKNVVVFLRAPELGQMRTLLPSDIYSADGLRYIVQDDVVHDAHNLTWTMPLNDFAAVVATAN